jgi:divalent metal cation (Fe/Co/Zn/Cd) transporter
MVAFSQTIQHNTLSRIQQIQVITIVWMTIEAVASLFAAWQARSPALIAFGGDSAVELLSAIVVLWRFRSGFVQSRTERTASRIAGISLFALAAYVSVVSALSFLGRNEPTTSYLGIAILIAAAILMPWLATEKRKLSAASGRLRTPSRFRPIWFVCLSFVDCTYWPGRECGLAFQLG